MLFGALLQVAEPVHAQQSASHWSVGLNAVPVMTGTPEFFVDRTITTVISASFSGGVTSTDHRCCGAVDDQVEEYQLEGGYVKTGLTVHPFGNDRHTGFFVQGRYVASWYKEKAMLRIPEGVGELPVRRSSDGLAHGIAMSLGGDLKFRDWLGMRLGLQVGGSFRSDYIGSAARTIQPGLGGWMGLRNQWIFALWYRFGQPGPLEHSQKNEKGGE